jgi:hypothetical protein
MVLDTASICYEQSQNRRHLADSDHRSCLWLCGGSYELYLPQLDTLTARSKGGAAHIAKRDANHPTPSEPPARVLPLGR